MNLGLKTFRALQLTAQKQKQIKGGGRRRYREIIVTDIDII